MSVKIISKSHSIRGKIENFSQDLKNITLKQHSTLKLNQDLHKLEFIFEFQNYPPNHHLRVKETIEHLCWVNSPLYKQAESIGWVNDANKLPKYDNEDLYLPHSLYRLLDKDFMNTFCYHIKSLAPESNGYTSGNVGRGGRNAA